MNKKGQGLSLNVIIVAALALIVLVVLIVVFTGRIAIFDRESAQQGSTDLATMKLQYGSCHPNQVEEGRFTAAVSRAEIPEDKQAARDDFRNVINNCKVSDSSSACETNPGCDWQ
ncbi:MAG TPA: hypothetical protein VJI98_04885 [Candidatus Nanoarchaeia archaeon]|nr:hypothetical protein [Candidatus Nanoarchaeia archaeon]